MTFTYVFKKIGQVGKLLNTETKIIVIALITAELRNGTAENYTLYASYCQFFLSPKLQVIKCWLIPTKGLQ